jgi:hypothetical protein
MKRIKSLLLSIFAAVADTLHRYLFSYLQRAGLLLMVGHSATETTTGALYGICAVLPATYDASGYGATTLVFTNIDRVESFGVYGSKRSVNDFRPINQPVEKIKGAPNYGDAVMTMADMPLDAGQVILKAAEVSMNHYSMKITYADGEIHYLDVINSEWSLSQAKEGAALVRTALLGICKAPVVVAA